LPVYAGKRRQTYCELRIPGKNMKSNTRDCHSECSEESIEDIVKLETGNWLKY